jgi:putative OPT family oligopeptide transporter
MIGAGYLVGRDMAVSIFLGACLAWFVALPWMSYLHPDVVLAHATANEVMLHLWDNDIRYLGIGAMLCAGIWTFMKLIKPLMHRIRMSWQTADKRTRQEHAVARTDKDIPMLSIIFGVVVMGVLLLLFFQRIFPTHEAGLNHAVGVGVVIGAVLYVLVVGFLFSVITAYFSGMVGVTASPGSSVVIAGILFAAWMLLSVLYACVPLPFSHEQLKAAEAMTIIIGSIVTGIAAIANDNSQDLKVGQLVGATPWKQQVMLLLGVLVSALVIPPVMHLLFDVYGIAGVMPREGMDPTQSLPAPTAALLAAITAAVFHHQLPWMMMLFGAGIILSLVALNRLMNWKRFFQLSVLGVAVGMYLPLSSSVPLFIGGMMSYAVNRMLNKQSLNDEQRRFKKQTGTLIACGLVAGAALLDVLLACVFSFSHNQDVLALVGSDWTVYGFALALVSVVGLGAWMMHRVSQ